jgi:hypothetical protein
MAYGYEVRNPHDRKVEASKKFLQLISEKGAPGKLLVNEFPFCEYSLRDRDNIDVHPH